MKNILLVFFSMILLLSFASCGILDCGQQGDQSSGENQDVTDKGDESCAVGDPFEKHKYIKTSTVMPDCTERGYTVYTCEACGNAYIGDYTDTLGHTYESNRCIRCGDIGDEGITYTLSSDGKYYIVSEYSGTSDVVEIPDEHNGLPVKEIQWCAFESSRNLTDVMIGNNVTVIGVEAFFACPNLKNVIISDSVKTIEERAFSYCTSMTNLTIGSGVTKIEQYAFYNCAALTSVVIPDSVKTIAECAFSNCGALTDASIGSGVNGIDERVFEKCNSLSSITVDENNEYYSSIDGNLYSKDGTILVQYALGKADTCFVTPDSVTEIGYRAFAKSTVLTEIIFTDNVIRIGEGAASECTALESITIGQGVTNIGMFAFSKCSSLTAVTIPDNVTSIGGYAFTYCSALKNVTIGSGVTAIEWFTFASCPSLESIIILNRISHIGEYAFAACTGLKDIYYIGTADEWAEISIDINNEDFINATVHCNYTE